MKLPCIVVSKNIINNNLIALSNHFRYSVYVKNNEDAVYIKTVRWIFSSYCLSITYFRTYKYHEIKNNM